MRLGVASIGDPRNRNTWSGIPFSVSSALTDLGYSVHQIALSRPTHWDNRRSQVESRQRRSWPDRSSGYLRRIAEELDAASRGIDALICLSTLPLVYRRTVTPTALWVDSTFPLLLDYYDAFRRVPPNVVAKATEAEHKGVAGARVLAGASHWVLNGLAELRSDASTPTILAPFGANILPGEFGLIPPIRSTVRRVLFIGRDWHRKGGQLVVDAVRIVRSTGRDIELCIVSGSAPPFSEGWIHRSGSLDPSNIEDRRSLSSLLISTDLFVMPSRAECFGCVFSEAAAFGVPSIGIDTGGVADAIESEVSGMLLPENSDAATLATQIEALIQDPQALSSLSRGAIHRSNTSANWHQSTARIVSALLGSTSSNA